MFSVFLIVLKCHRIEWNMFSAFLGRNTFVVIKQHFLVAIADTSPIVLRECIQSALLMYTYHFSSLSKFFDELVCVTHGFMSKNHHVDPLPYLPELEKKNGFKANPLRQRVHEHTLKP